MDHIPIANLEAELGCFDQGLVDIGPRKDHGGSDKLFEVPTEAASCLEPPSDTKCVYPFGADGTLAWATPAGELLQLASCTNGKLAGVDYKKSIQKGKDYDARTKMLQTALNLPQGSGNGIGLSLDHALQPTHVHWVHNRWPRFIYEFHGLEIRLQYYVTSQSVVQQYQIRNTTDEDIPLPYIISTDILFRDHELDSETFRPIPHQKTSERLMLSQNLELLVSDELDDVQFEIAVFLNKQRISIWRDHQPSDGESEPNGNVDSEVVDQPFLWTEKWLRETILDKKCIPSYEQQYRLKHLYELLETSPPDRRFQTYNRTNCAKFHNTLLVPGGSTQELCAIVKLTGPLQTETASSQSATKPIKAQSKDLAINGQSLSDHYQKTISTIQCEEIFLIGQETEYFDISDTRRKAQIFQQMEKRRSLGQALVSVRQVERARYYFFTELLIAETYYKDDVVVLSGIRFRYAKFLLRHGWYSHGSKEMLEDLVQSIPNEEGIVAKTTKFWPAVREVLASVYLNLGRFSEAENLFQQCLQHLKQESSTLESQSASILQRIAWAKVNKRQQDQYEEASEIYSRLLDQGSGSRRTLLSNLGFVKRKLGQFADAKEFYQRAINEGSKSDSTYDTDKIFAKSGLSSCLRSLRATPESIDRQAASSIKYIDINDTFSQLQYLLLPSKEHHPFDFVVSRHVETLLSVCSMPIKSNGVSGTMFLNADPVECAHEGRNAFFQFKFLIQYHRYLSKMNHRESADAKRIQAACEAHLSWVFKIAPTQKTWLPRYPVGSALGIPSMERPSEEDPVAYVVEGAFNFLKLCLYHETWVDEWESVLELMHPALKDWLSHLVNTQHMDNLWVEKTRTESFKPQYDSLSRDQAAMSLPYPEYELSNFSVLWLALKKLEHLMASIENKIDSQNRDREDTATHKFQKFRETFNSRRPTLDPEKIKSRIINTFKVFPKDSVGELYATDTTTNSTSIIGGESPAFTGPLDNTPMAGDPRNNVGISLQEGAIGRRNQQLIVFRRSIKGSSFEVQPTDISTFEAYASGMFEDPQEQDAWHATINNQEERSTTTPWDTRLIALALLGLKIGHDFVRIDEDKIEDVDSANEKSKEVLLRTRLSAATYNSGCFAVTTATDQPEQVQSYSGVLYEPLSVLMASLYEECQTLLLHQEKQYPGDKSQPQIPTTKTIKRAQIRKRPKKTGTVNTFPRVSQKNVHDTEFLPDWMYLYPAFIHNQPLVVSSEQDLKQLSSIEGLQSAIDKYKASQGFSYVYWENARIPAVFNFGINKRTNPGDAYAEPPHYWNRYSGWESFWAHLLAPRTPVEAKKRLIEFPSQAKHGALMCWLSSPPQERPSLWLFFSRNNALENFFGERADLVANLWETELHLGFYQLMPAFSDWSHSREMPSLSQDKARLIIAPVALSFRFVGDLRDRFWTCLFLSSTIGFAGLGQLDCTQTSISLEQLGQRKILEVFYVERMLQEMSTSTRRILDEFKAELAVPPKSQNFDFVYLSSGLQFHLEAKDTLQDVLQKLDLSIKAIEDWEKREDTRGFPSRWSLKDEERYGKLITNLTQRCKTNLRNLRMQHNQFVEQRKNADQWYNNLMSYKQLQEAHTSTQLAEDVRLFTYVTIIFLPLSFSSSLFSMQAAPDAKTLVVMGPTTVVALALTILLLANMNLLSRKLKFWFEKAKHKTRREMASSGGSSLFNWVRVSKELTEAAQLQNTGMDTKKRLPAESKWWYFYFWLWYCFRWSSNRIRDGMWAWENRNGPSLGLIVSILLALVCSLACTLVFMVKALMHMMIDAIKLIRAMLRRTQMIDAIKLIRAMLRRTQMIDAIKLIRAMLRRTQNRREDEGSSGRQDGEETDVDDSDSYSLTTTASTASKRKSVWVRIVEKLDLLLESPPRPIDDLRNKYFPSPSDQEAKDPARGLPRGGMHELLYPFTNGVVMEPQPNTSTNPAGGTTTDETRTQAGDLV